MKKLHKRQNTTVIDVEPNEGERTLLCSNRSGIRSPSLDFNPKTSIVTKEIAIDYLAEMLIAIFLQLKRNESRK